VCAEGVTILSAPGECGKRAPTLRHVPRPPRNFGDGIYHVGSHGSDTRDLFVGADERATFLDRLVVVSERFDLRLSAYVLLGNHYHFVLATPDARLSSALQQLHGWYSRWHNRRNGRSAHLFRAHFFAREIVSDADLLAVCLYLALNPVAAGLCDHPFSWPWSSAAATAGIVEPVIPLDHGPLRAALGGADWQGRYRRIIEATIEPAMDSRCADASRSATDEFRHCF
jgi:putative transposase